MSQFFQQWHQSSWHASIRLEVVSNNEGVAFNYDILDAKIQTHLCAAQNGKDLCLEGGFCDSGGSEGLDYGSSVVTDDSSDAGGVVWG